MQAIRSVLIVLSVLTLLLGCSGGGSDKKEAPSPGTSSVNTASFGYSGAFVDVNGDGLKDLVIGAPDTSDSEGPRGAVFVFLNTPEGFSNKYNWMFTGQRSGDKFGYSVAALGDINNDGYEDFAVGAIYAEGHTPLSGAVYIYRGGREAPELMTKLSGFNAFDVFGYAITSGDLNNDGYSDIVVSATQAWGDRYQSGVVYIYFGGESINSTPDIVINASPAVRKKHGQPALGTCMDTGDVNGDTIADLIVGDKYSVFLYFGGAGLAERFQTDKMPDVEIKVRNCRPRNGLSFAGDITGDGFGDIIVGYGRSGYVHIVKGSATMPAVFSSEDHPEMFIKISDGTSTARFGSSVAVIADINGGGLADILIGSQWTKDVSGITGRVYLFFSEDLNSSTTVSMAARQYTENLNYSNFGVSIDSDPAAQVFFVGAPEAYQFKGAAFVYNLQTDSTIQLQTN